MHAKVLELYDECFGRAFRKNAAWHNRTALFIRQAEALSTRRA